MKIYETVTVPHINNEIEKMKVDKAVCTTDTMTDAESAISYEKLLSTLVQKKILAIKRECEAKKVEKQKRKQKNCLGSLIFGNRHDRSNNGDNDNDDNDDDDGKDVDDKNNDNNRTTTKVVNIELSQKGTDTLSIDDMRKCDDNQTSVAHTVLPYNQIEQIDSIVLVNCAQMKNMRDENEVIAKFESSKCQIDVLNERCCSNENDNNATQTHDHFDGINDKQSVNGKKQSEQNPKHRNDDTQNIIEIPLVDSERGTQIDNNVIELDMESTSTTTNTKSPSIVSQIEVSDEINSKQQKSRARKNSNDTISVASSLKHTVLSAPADAMMAFHDQEQRHQQRLLEAKSISAQCSPIFAQRQTFTGTLYYDCSFFVHKSCANFPIF